VLSLQNTLPVFSEELEAEVIIKVIVSADGVLQNESPSFKYTSPVAEDKEGNEVTMKFSGLEELLGSRTKQNADSTFTISIDLGLVNAETSGDYTLSVQLGDEFDTEGPTLSMVIKITYEELEPKVEESEITNAEDSEVDIPAS